MVPWSMMQRRFLRMLLRAIRAARESGIRVAIASGRAWNEMNDVIEKLPCLRYFMCTNGAYVMDKDENRSLFHVNFDKEQALHLLLETINLWRLCRGPM